MSKKQLKAQTLQGVFRNSFGEKEGDEILQEIQVAYESGLTGEALQKKATEIVKDRKIPGGVNSPTDAAISGAITASSAAVAV